ncbi:NOP5C [Hepatospora eriocheir]|uniref:NOP5C n=1 Tax=Hepatospora eriocheir TaxID=1081669 RepID=A0A1X0QHE9_9MICR|nr:NOP5C [Hepatospora eriocheir]
MSKNQFLLFDHLNKLELFKLKSFEMLETKSFSDYMALLEVVTHISTLENIEIERVVDWLKFNKVEELHCDKSYEAYRTICKENKIEIITDKTNNIMRGVRQNIQKILKKSDEKASILKYAYDFSRKAVGELRNDMYSVHLAYEIQTIEREIESIEQLLIGKEDFILNEETNKFERIEIKDSSDLTVKILNEKRILYNELKEKLNEKINQIAPELRKVIGNDILVSKMIHKAGGLTNLAILPSSTLQLLGAEKSLFRALKFKKPTPKYGTVIYEALSKSDKKLNSRQLANAAAIAVKIDVFSNKD